MTDTPPFWNCRENIGRFPPEFAQTPPDRAPRGAAGPSSQPPARDTLLLLVALSALFPALPLLLVALSALFPEPLLLLVALSALFPALLLFLVALSALFPELLLFLVALYMTPDHSF